MNDNKLFIIDRFEEDWAIIEYGQITFNVPKEILPAGAAEGDVLTIGISVNKEMTEKRKQYIQQIASDLFREE
jgi:hypothetical protein